MKYNLKRMHNVEEYFIWYYWLYFCGEPWRLKTYMDYGFLIQISLLPLQFLEYGIRYLVRYFTYLVRREIDCAN